jgi:ribosomal protein L7Ae-like RNA K-turn-binding protein
LRKLTYAECRKRICASGVKAKLLSAVETAVGHVHLQCRKCGHEWHPRLAHVERGSGCPACAGTLPLTLEAVQKWALDLEGTCLSKEYKNKETKMLFRCKEGHKWEATFGNLRNQKSWCPLCSYKKKSVDKLLSIDVAQKAALERGGRCLSKKYVGIFERLEWECSSGHRWFSSLNSVRNQKTWCPHCHIYVGEEIVRSVFSYIFGMDFNKVKLGGYEFDGFNSKLKVAFEHHGGDLHGKERIRTTPFLKTSDRTLRRDDERVSYCKGNDIALFVCWDVTLKDDLNELAKKIYKFASLHKIPVKVKQNCFNDKRIDLSSVFNDTRQDAIMEKIEPLCKKSNVSLIEIESKYRLEFQCNKCRSLFSLGFHWILKKEEVRCRQCHPVTRPL